MKKILVVLLILIVLLAVLYWARNRTGEGPVSRVDAVFPELLADAARPADPSTGGDPWPEDAVFRTLRSEWHELGSADSTLIEQLTQDWIYPQSRTPHRLTVIGQTPAGAGYDLEARLRIADAFRRHPHWKIGSMRFYPAVAAALGNTEKLVIQYLARQSAKGPFTAPDLAAKLGLSGEEVLAATNALAELGWLARDGEGETALYSLPDPTIAAGGAMVFLTYKPTQGRSHDLAGLDAAFEYHKKDLAKQRVVLRGNCAETGRPIEVDIVNGRLRSGRPGKAFASSLSAPGRSNGLFVSESAFQAWTTRNPGVAGSDSGLVPAYYHRRMGES